MSRHPRSAPLVIIIAALLAFTASASAQPTTTWTSEGGVASLDLPTGWARADGATLADPVAGAARSLLALARTDGHATLGVYAPPDTLVRGDERALGGALAQFGVRYRVALRRPTVVVIGDRELAIAEGSWDDRGSPVAVFAAVTAVRGRPLLLLATASGPDRAAILFEAQMALGTLVVPPDAVIPRPTAAPPTAAATAATPTAGPVATEPARQAIPGTGVTLDVPPGFVESLVSPGFVADEGSTYIYVTFTPLRYALMRSTVNPPSLSRVGRELVEVTDLTIDGRPAVLALVKANGREGTVREWNLITGTEAQSLTVHGGYGESAPPGRGADLRDALKSVSWDPAAAADPLAGLPFSLSETRHLRILCRSHDRVVLAPAGTTLPAERAPVLAIVSSFPCPSEVPDPAAFARQCAEESAVADSIRVTEVKEIAMAGGTGFAVIGTAERPGGGSGQDFYCAVAVREGRAYVVQGVQEAYAAEDLFDEFAVLAAKLRPGPPAAGG